MRFKRLNRFNVFLLVGGLAFAAISQIGCFRPDSSLEIKGEDIRASFVGETSEPSISSMDQRTVSSVERYRAIVMRYSNQYDLDWRLVMAVIRQESRFTADALSKKGAFGLMQLMPSTRLELAGKIGLSETATAPNNIRAGIYHLQKLYRSIDAADEENHVRLTLAAYNAGLNRILDAQDVASYMGDDPNKWESVKTALPLLARRYESLQHNIWPLGKARTGFFGGWRQTIGYVESVMTYYDEYQVALR